MIKVKKLSYYRGDKLVIDDLDCQLDSGELVLLTGSNGAGKSTLISLIGGVLSPSAGEITIHGKSLLGLKSNEQAKLRSIAPQRREFFLAFKVIELLQLLPASRRSFYIDSIIGALELSELLQMKITELSVGEQQRVSLAIALMQDADFYLLDEPFSGQDTQSIKRILNLLKEIKNEKGVLVVSHNAENLRPYFDREIKLA